MSLINSQVNFDIPTIVYDFQFFYDCKKFYDTDVKFKTLHFFVTYELDR